MSYLANYETAITYLDAGLADRCIESLDKALEEFTEEDEHRDPKIFMHILSLLAKFALERGHSKKAYPYVVRGLEFDDSHADFLFLKAMLCWDEQLYDEMLEALVEYLSRLVSFSDDLKFYVFVSDAVMHEIFDCMLPECYRHAKTAPHARETVEKIADKTKHALFIRALEVMQQLEVAQQNSP